MRCRSFQCGITKFRLTWHINLYLICSKAHWLRIINPDVSKVCINQLGREQTHDFKLIKVLDHKQCQTLFFRISNVLCNNKRNKLHSRLLNKKFIRHLSTHTFFLFCRGDSSKFNCVFLEYRDTTTMCVVNLNFHRTFKNLEDILCVLEFLIHAIYFSLWCLIRDFVLNSLTKMFCCKDILGFQNRPLCNGKQFVMFAHK